MAGDFLVDHPTYQYIRALSQGASGTVVLYKHRDTEENVAIKFMDREASVSDSKYVELEVLNHRWLKHPHVVKFKELFLTPKHICIVMEFANGGTLFKQVAAAGRLDEHAARWFFQQLLIALDYCHRPGRAKPSIFNRDIKLENILLENVEGQPFPYVKICDFGYSKNSYASRPKTQVGTPSYMAPEVVRGEKYDGEKADIWSCGVTLYVLLVGDYPFGAKAKQGGTQQHVQEVVSRILEGDWQLPQEIARTLTSECRDLLSRLLQADPAQRISMSSIMQHPWFLSNLPPAALHINAQCLDITDYSDVQTEADIKAILAQVQASVRVEDLIDAAIGEEQGPCNMGEIEDDPDPFGLRQTEK